MFPFEYSSLTRGQRLALAAAGAAPFLLVALLKAVGLMGLARLGVMGLVGLSVLAVFFTHPRWGVYFMAFYVYSGIAKYLPGIVPVAVMAVITLPAVLGLFRGEDDRVNDGVFLAIVCLFSMITLQSVLFSHHPEHSLASLMAVVKAFALVFLVVHFVRTPGQLRELVFAIFVGTLATIVFGVINLKLGLYTTGNVIGGVEIYRFSGAHPNPNRAAAIICSAIPLGLFIARNVPGVWRRALAYAGVIALVIGVFSTFSRSAIFPFSVVALAVVAREIRSRGGLAAVAALLIVGILLTPQYYWDRLSALSDVRATGMFTDMSVAIRYDAMRTAWKLFLDHPLTGIGFYDFIYRRASDVVAVVVTHNTYLEILVGTGIFGFAAFMGSVVAGLRHAAYGTLRVWARENESMRALSFYVGLTGVSIMISAMFGSMPFIYAFWMPVACGLVLGNLIQDESVTN